MMSKIDAPVRQVRYVELDSLRGLAALIVVLHHVLYLWETDTQPTSAACRFFLDLINPFGFEAVILFFVLSGFVLSLPAVDGKPQTYLTFITRRIFRIYVPYLAALAVTVAGAFWLHGTVTASDWFQATWSEPVRWRTVWQHVMFLGVFNSDLFNPPIWSLVYEMRISLILPFLCGFVLRFKSKWSFAIAAGLTATAIVLGRPPFHLGLGMADTFHYAGLFVFGIFLAREKSNLGDWFRRRRRLVKVSIGGAFLWLWLFAGPLSAGGAGAFPRHSLLCASQWITALGAGGLMIVSMNSESCKRVLSWRPVHFLGQISYSLYLWHFVVLLYCVHLLYGRMPLLAVLCLAFVLSVIVSWFSYRWIEIPSIHLGRRLSNVFQRPSAT